MLALRWGDVDFEQGILTIEKSRSVAAAYIGDLGSTIEKYYIAVRKKHVVEGKVQQIVELPEAFQTEEAESKRQDISSA